MSRSNLKSKTAAANLAAILEYKIMKEEQEMANRKTAKKKRLQEQKRQEVREAQLNTQGGKNNG